MVVSGANHMEIIRRGDPAELGFKHIRNVCMKRSPPRRPFLEMGRDVNEKRFNLPDTFDKSTYLTTRPKTKSLMPFEGFAPREPLLIDKGGDIGVSLGGKADVIYNYMDTKLML